MKNLNSKKSFTAFFAALLSLCLVSCSVTSDSARATDIVYSAIAECKELNGSYTVYFSDGTEGENGFISPEDFYALYYTEIEPANELSLLSEWCIAISSSPEVKELHVLKAKSRSECERISEMLERRAKMLSSPELYRSQSEFLGSRPKDVRVFTSGCFVILAAAQDTSAIADFFK